MYTDHGKNNYFTKFDKVAVIAKAVMTSKVSVGVVILLFFKYLLDLRNV